MCMPRILLWMDPQYYVVRHSVLSGLWHVEIALCTLLSRGGVWFHMSLSFLGSPVIFEILNLWLEEEILGRSPCSMLLCFGLI